MSLFPSANTIYTERCSEVPKSEENQLHWLNNASYQDARSDRRYQSKTSLQDDEELPNEDPQKSQKVTHCHKDKKSSSSHEDSIKRESQRRKKESKYKKHRKSKEIDGKSYHDDSHSERGKRSSSKSKSRHRSRSRSRSREKKYQKLAQRPSSIWLDDCTDMSGDLFYLDPKPDRNNLSFDTLDYKDAAFYKSLGRTCLGGAHLNERIFWSDKSKGKAKIKHSRKGRYFSHFAALVSSDKTITMTNVKKTENDDTIKRVSGFTDSMEVVETHEADTFILVEKKMNSTSSHLSEIDPLGLYDEATRQYLGISAEIMKKSQREFSSTAETPIRNPTTERIAYFNKCLSDNPQDIVKWIEFIHFQNELVKSTIFNPSPGIKQGKLKNQDQLLAQRKLSILEKALEKNPGCLELQLEQVEICRDVWESTKVSALWTNMLKDHRGNKDLWHHYILFCQSLYSSFSVSSISSIYAECIQNLLEHVDEEGSKVTETDIFGIFIQLCHFWHQAGHTEKTIAAFQAMIELNFFCPQHLEQSTALSAQLAFLETFWDSDEPKFGETGAKGWSHWMHMKEKGGWQQTAASNADDEDDTMLDPSLTKVEAWLMEESARGSCHLLPWRPNPSKGQTTDDCDDPDRLVLFDDISKVLFKLTGTDTKFQFVLGLLELLGIQNEAMLTTNSSHTHNFLHTVLQSTQQLLHCKFAINLGGNNISRESVVSSWHSVWQKSCPGILNIFEELKDERTISNKYKRSETNDESKQLSEFVDNITDQLVPKVSHDQQSVLRLMQLRFHLTNITYSKEPKMRKKQLKSVQRNAKRTLSLESNRNNLALWEAYALWEWGVGNNKESQRIFETALSFAGVPRNDSEIHSYTRLVHTVATLKLHEVFVKQESEAGYRSREKGQTDSDMLRREAINALTTLGEGVKFVPLSQYHDSVVASGRILKARKRFVDLLEECKMEYSPIVGPALAPEIEDLVTPSGSYLYHLSSCYALFQYLTVSSQAARVVFQDILSFLEKVPANSTDEKLSLLSSQKELDNELVTVAEIQLLSFHTGVCPVPLTELRSVLQKAITKYPSNAALLEVFLQTERKCHIMGRLRKHFRHVTEDTQSPVPIFYALLSELKRQESIQEASVDRPMTSNTPDRNLILTETGISHQIRSLFERAVRFRYTRHCILFWRMYIQFEVSQGNMKNAKSIFYRALYHCPWSKALYTDIIRYLPEEMEEIIDLLMEKELRVRVPLEEIELLMNASKEEKNQ